MTKRRTYQEQLEEIEKKEKQLKERKRDIKAKLSAEERKARTKRLIEVGGAVESVTKRPIEKDDLPKLIKFLEDQEKRGRFLSKALGFDDSTVKEQNSSKPSEIDL